MNFPSADRWKRLGLGRETTTAASDAGLRQAGGTGAGAGARASPIASRWVTCSRCAVTAASSHGAGTLEQLGDRDAGRSRIAGHRAAHRRRGSIAANDWFLDLDPAIRSPFLPTRSRVPGGRGESRVPASKRTSVPRAGRRQPDLRVRLRAGVALQCGEGRARVRARAASPSGQDARCRRRACRLTRAM